jgi:DNA (cytosine-5)-methyltransferase 1
MPLVAEVIGTLQARDYKGLNHEGARDGKAIVENQLVRRLTPVECERLQGFPDNWTEGQSDSARYKQMGNAVAVPVVEWILGNICDTLKEAE